MSARPVARNYLDKKMSNRKRNNMAIMGQGIGQGLGSLAGAAAYRMMGGKTRAEEE